MSSRSLHTATYNRIESAAGGAFAPPKAFARAFIKRLSPEGRKPENRKARREVWSDILAMREESQALLRSFRL